MVLRFKCLKMFEAFFSAYGVSPPHSTPYVTTGVLGYGCDRCGQIGKRTAAKTQELGD